MAHELGHAEDLVEGKGINYNSEKANDGSSRKDVELGNQSEKNAMRKENIVQKAIQIEKREYNYYIYKGK